MSYPIRKGVPIPPKGSRHNKLYNLREMEIGDSIMIPGDPRIVRRRAASAMHWARKKYGYKFTERSYPEGLGVWRIA